MWLKSVLVILVVPMTIFSYGNWNLPNLSGWGICETFAFIISGMMDVRRSPRSAFSIKFMNITERISSVEKPSVRNKNPRISFSKTSDLTHIASNLFRCPKNKTDVECANKTSEFKNKVIQELVKSVSKLGEENIYNVNYQSETNQTRKPSICMLLENKIKLLRKKDPPFNKNKLGQLFPKHKLFRKSKGKSCVIVSSAGSLTSSNLGSFIGELKSFKRNFIVSQSFYRLAWHRDEVQSCTDRRIWERCRKQDLNKDRKFAGK